MSSKATSSGLSFGTLLFLVFLVLKLVGVITWSWWWVTCPLWIGAVLLLGTIFVIFLIAVIAALITFVCNR